MALPSAPPGPVSTGYSGGSSSWRQQQQWHPLLERLCFYLSRVLPLKGQDTWPDNHGDRQTPAHIVFLELVSVTVGTSLRVLVNSQPSCALPSVVPRGPLVTRKDGRIGVGIQCWWGAEEECEAREKKRREATLE